MKTNIRKKKKSGYQSASQTSPAGMSPWERNGIIHGMPSNSSSKSADESQFDLSLFSSLDVLRTTRPEKNAVDCSRLFIVRN